MIDERVLKSDERAIIALRSLYKSYGYLPFKMSKFEEYDMYVGNKDFLVSDKIITFAGTDGRLLALKPDVTLSIIKNAARDGSPKEKLYYNETVYRPSGSTGEYKEIMQTGIESVGELDTSDICEAVYLAAKSLSEISADFIIDVSHMGVLKAALELAGADGAVARELTEAIARKSSHEITAISERSSIDKKATELLLLLADFSGDFSDAAELLLRYLPSDGAAALIEELVSIGKTFDKSEWQGRVRPDFSAVSNMNYYNGIVFSGFISGISDRVLAGGEYSGLLENMGRTGRAVGFALYLDRLSELDSEDEGYDVDVLLLYSDKTDMDVLFKKREELISAGKTVSAQRTSDMKVRYREIVDIG